MKIVFVAAENGALSGGKVGGVADVVDQLSRALAGRGCSVTVITPSYGYLQERNGGAQTEAFSFRYRGHRHRADLWEVFSHTPQAGVRHLVVDHPQLEAKDPQTGVPAIYFHDPDQRPFATDADRFSLFGAAVAAAAAAGLLGKIDVLHLHDWHAAPVALLRRFSPFHAALKPVRTVFTIHNLSFQGIRPLTGDRSSLSAWFPGLPYDPAAVMDPRWPDCVNWMKAGIGLSDAVSTVSPTYAEEIRVPGDPPAVYGAEGLEHVLAEVHRAGRLTGILNGCPPQKIPSPPPQRFPELGAFFRSQIHIWAAAEDRVDPAHFLAADRLRQWAADTEPPEVLLTFIGRLVDQKILLLAEPGKDGRTALERILAELGQRGWLVLLGSGVRKWERRLVQIAAKHGNMIFLRGFSEPCAEALYRCGDLFLMPSVFEPCGIGQMLAMREGQPCVVHAVGGLRDTVIDGETGFAFSEETTSGRIDAFVAATRRALELRRTRPERWEEIRRRAAATRFSWNDAARRYLRLYRGRS